MKLIADVCLFNKDTGVEITDRHNCPENTTAEQFLTKMIDRVAGVADKLDGSFMVDFLIYDSETTMVVKSVRYQVKDLIK